MGTVAVDIKWQKEVFKGVEIDMSQPPIVFKNQLFSLTGARHFASDSRAQTPQLMRSNTTLLLTHRLPCAAIQLPPARRRSDC